MADTKVGGVYIEIQAKMGRLESDLKAIEARLQQTDNKASGLSSTFSGMGKYLAEGVIAGGLALIAKRAVEGAANLEQQSTAFTVLLGSASKAKVMLDDLKQLAAFTPFSQADMIQNAKLLLNFGVSADKVKDILSRLGDIASGDAGKLSSLTLAFSQASAAGKLSGQDLLQMINAGFNPLQEISAKTGESMASLKKKMEEGKITVKMMEGAFISATSAGGRFYQMNEKQSKTLTGQWSTLKDNIDVALTSMGGGASNPLKNVLSSTNELLSLINKSTAASDFLGTVLGASFSLILVPLQAVIEGWRMLLQYLEDNKATENLENMKKGLESQKAILEELKKTNADQSTIKAIEREIKAREELIKKLQEEEDAKGVRKNEGDEIYKLTEDLKTQKKTLEDLQKIKGDATTIKKIQEEISEKEKLIAKLREEKKAREELGNFWGVTDDENKSIETQASLLQDITDTKERIRVKSEELAKAEKENNQFLINLLNDVISKEQKRLEEKNKLYTATVQSSQKSADAEKAAADAVKKADDKKTSSGVNNYKQLKKAAEDLAKTINSSYLNALGSVDEKIDQQQADLQTQYDKMASDYKKNAITYEQYEKAKDEINKQYKALEMSRFEKNLEDMATKYGTVTAGLTQLSGSLSQVISMSVSNQTTEIDNKLQKQLDAIDTTYNAEVEAINNSVLSEEEKNAKLKALDEQKARDTEAAQKKADKEKRKLNRDAAKKQKAISIFETVLATPQAAMQAYKAMAGIPIVGPALGAIAAAAATALGIAKLKLIKDTPLPEAAYGGIVPAVPGGTPVRVSEAGSSEAIIPLNSQGIGILKQAFQGEQGGVSNLNVYLDGAVFGKWLFNSTKSGTVQFHANGLVS